MTTEKVYVALLRGINVAGSKVILMGDLKNVFEGAGFSQVKTYIQSGNVVFMSRGKEHQGLERVIKDVIKGAFRFDVRVAVLELSELERIIQKNPYDGTGLKKGERIYLTILSEKPDKERVGELRKAKNSDDDFEVIGKTVYMLCRKGYAKSVFNNNAIEKVLKVNATTRNLETMIKLVEMGKSI